MKPDAMTTRLNLRRMRVLGVVGDVMERLVVVAGDLRGVVRCGYCGFTTATVHDRHRYLVHDLPTGGQATTLVWVRRRCVREG